jgi:hypothetical protein
MNTRQAEEPEGHEKQRMIPRLLCSAVTVRYCGPLEYALRILGEIALLAATLAALEWLLPVYRLLSLAAWAVCAALTALDITLLRLRRTVSEARPVSDRRRSYLIWGPVAARQHRRRHISPARRVLYASLAAANALTCLLLAVFLVIVPFLNWLGALPGAAINGYEGYWTSVCLEFHPPSQCGLPGQQPDSTP